MNSEDDRLYSKLKEDMGTGSDDVVKALLPLVSQLQMPPPTNASTQVLIARLKTEMPQRRSRWREQQALLMSQIRIIQRELWLASFMLMAMGLALTLTQSNSMFFAMIAPFAAAMGVAFLYNEAGASVEELENSTQTPASLLLLTRLTLLFTFDLVLALLCSVILALVLPQVSLVPLIESWFAPMSFLSGLAFFLSVVLLEPFAAMMFSLTLWAAHLLLRAYNNGHFWLWVASLPGLSTPEMRPMLLCAAGALLIGALFFQSERTQ